jgi:PAS domain S-box-containing protein
MKSEILQNILDHAPIMISFTGEDGQVKMVSREWERTLGWTREEIQRCGIDIFTECYPDPLVRREVMSFIAAAKSEWAYFKPRARDGRTLDTRWVEVPLSDGTSFGIGVEITEQERIDEALRESQREFRQLADHLLEVLWIVDLKTDRVLFVNPAYEQIWGRTCESLYRDPRSFMDGIHPEDRPRFLDAYEAQTRRKSPLNIRYRVIRPDGSTRWIRDRSFPVRDASGEVYRFVGIAEDITEQARTDEDLRRIESHLTESERLGHIGTWAIDVRTRKIAFWSKERSRLFGFDPAMGVPTIQEVLARFHPEDGAALGTLTQALDEMKAFDLEYRILLPNGSVRYIHSLGRPVMNDAGEPVEFRGIAMDVTDQKLAQDALRRSADQLRALAARVESVREEERTRVSREIHDELGQALTGIKLELRSYALDLPAENRTLLEHAELILRLVDEALLSVRRIASDLRPGLLDDLGLLAAIEWETGQFQARTGIQCRLEVAEEDLSIAPDAATALFRILQEALTNVARHAGATNLSVRLTSATGGLSLQVHDNGRGASYERLSAPTSLGILGMRERALLLGGEFTVQSMPGEGTTVSVRLPAPATGKDR